MFSSCRVGLILKHNSSTDLQRIWAILVLLDGLLIQIGVILLKSAIYRTLHRRIHLSCFGFSRPLIETIFFRIFCFFIENERFKSGKHGAGTSRHSTWVKLTENLIKPGETLQNLKKIGKLVKNPMEQRNVKQWIKPLAVDRNSIPSETSASLKNLGFFRPLSRKVDGKGACT